MKPPVKPATITIPTGCPSGQVKLNGACIVPPVVGPVPGKLRLPPERCAPGTPTEPNASCALVTPPGSFSQADVGLMTHELCGDGAVTLWVAVILTAVCQ